MPYRVLLPVDTNDRRARAQAKFVANLPAADEAVEAIVLFVFHGDSEELPDELERFAGVERIESVRRATESLEERGVTVRHREDSGDPARRIVASADEHDVDLIVMGGRKRSPAGSALFGSVTQSVLRRTDRPIVVTGSIAE